MFRSFSPRAREINSEAWERVGELNGGWAENFQLWRFNGTEYLVGTGDVGSSKSHAGFVAPMLGDGSNATQWIEWGARRELAIPQQDWTPFAADNAVFLADWTRRDGYVYAIYCGMRREGGGKGNGFNSIGIARSRDTLVWEVPGAVSA